MILREQLERSAAIRQSYTRLPFQGFWTWLTGKELHGRVSRSISPLESAAWAIALFLGGMAASVAISLSSASAFWLLISMTLTVSGARYIVATVIHHGVHHAVFRSERANLILCELLSTLTVVQPFHAYRQFHVYEHHGRDFSTMGDQDLAAIYMLGLRPGVPIERMRWILLWQCVNPMFHLRYAWGRIKSNLVDAPAYRIAMTLMWFSALAGMAHVLGLQVFLISIALPLTALYQICSLLHLVTEHAWVLRSGGEKVRDSHVKNSHGRFCGRMLPASGLSGMRWLRAWSGWWAEHLLVHLPARLLIVQGSLIVHDWHHRAGADRGWPNAIQRREADLQKEYAQGVYSYTDIWGIHHVIDEVMRRISAAPAAVPLQGLRYRLN